MKGLKIAEELNIPEAHANKFQLDFSSVTKLIVGGKLDNDEIIRAGIAKKNSCKFYELETIGISNFVNSRTSYNSTSVDYGKG